MAKKFIVGWGDGPDNVLKPPLSPAVCVGEMIYTSGQLGLDPDGNFVPGGIEQQARATLVNLKSVLERAGSTLGDVVKTMVWLKDPADFRAFNKVYAEFFPDNFPARSTVRSELMLPDALVEIEAVAIKSQ